jgi:hypothetical protein
MHGSPPASEQSDPALAGMMVQGKGGAVGAIFRGFAAGIFRIQQIV